MICDSFAKLRAMHRQMHIYLLTHALFPMTLPMYSKWIKNIYHRQGTKYFDLFVALFIYFCWVNFSISFVERFLIRAATPEYISSRDLTKNKLIYDTST